MRIVSYRGPNEPGGVSSALTRVFEAHVAGGDWWFVSDGAISRKMSQVSSLGTSLDMFEVCPDLRSGHYQYCNNFLWPVLHDLPQYAHYSPHERLSYHGFNLAFAQNLNARSDDTFVNDYQFALLPLLLQNPSIAFWHVPWPARVAAAHVPFIKELAAGLLKCRVIGFHTDEYVSNFLHFVSSELPHCSIDRRLKVVYGHPARGPDDVGTVVRTAPLGINLQYWSHCLSNLPARQSGGGRFVLSVDRADYTKGVVERLQAIDRFFQLYPEWRGEVRFHQIVTRTRQGFSQFDNYFERCSQMVEAINSRWSGKEWSPILWQTTPVHPAELAVLYRRASVMLVNPIRDGLNMTAKEYVACQGDSPGVLALSSGAGVSVELGRSVVPVAPAATDDFAHAIARSLQMSETEKKSRMSILKAKLLENSLSAWWHSMQRGGGPEVLAPSAAINSACG